MSKKSRPWSYQERRRRKTVQRAKDTAWVRQALINMRQITDAVVIDRFERYYKPMSADGLGPIVIDEMATFDEAAWEAFKR